MMIHPSNIDTVIVGAGPVGLATAIQAKILNPDREIVVVERREALEEYPKKQKLRLDASSFNYMPDDERLNSIIEGFKEKRLVPIEEIEAQFAALAEELGIHFHYGFKVEEEKTLPIDKNFEEVIATNTFDELFKIYPKAKCIVGADGVRSAVRRLVFKNNMENQFTTKYLAQLKYETVEGDNQRLRGFDQTRASKIARTFVKEAVDPKSVSLRFFIDEETFNPIAHANARDPLTLDSTEIPKQLKEQIQNWMEYRNTTYGETIVEGSEELISIQLDIYNSSETVKKCADRIVCLVGDAAGGVPFFRSINKGFLESSALARAIAEEDLTSFNEEAPIPHRFVQYQKRTRQIARWENFVAKTKSFFISVFIGLIKFSAILSPTRLIRWAERTSLSRNADEGIEQPSLS